MERKIVLKQDILAALAEAIDLRKSGVSDVKLNLNDFCIKTPKLCIKGITYLDSLRALLCDECFGFSREYAISLRRNHSAYGFDGTVIEYVLQQEKKLNNDICEGNGY